MRVDLSDHPPVLADRVQFGPRASREPDGLGGKRETELLETGENEGVDRVAGATGYGPERGRRHSRSRPQPDRSRQRGFYTYFESKSDLYVEVLRVLLH